MNAEYVEWPDTPLLKAFRDKHTAEAERDRWKAVAVQLADACQDYADADGLDISLADKVDAAIATIRFMGKKMK